MADAPTKSRAFPPVHQMRFLRVLSTYPFSRLTPRWQPLLPLTQRDNSSCELRNPVCRLPFETFSCQTIFFKNRPPVADYSTEFVKSRGGPNPPIHNPQDFHGTQGQWECTSSIKVSDTHPEFLPFRGEHLILETTSFISASSRGGGRKAGTALKPPPPSPPLIPLFFSPLTRADISCPIPSCLLLFLSSSSPIPTLSTNGKEY